LLGGAAFSFVHLPELRLLLLLGNTPYRVQVQGNGPHHRGFPVPQTAVKQQPRSVARRKPARHLPRLSHRGGVPAELPAPARNDRLISRYKGRGRPVARKGQPITCWNASPGGQSL